MKYDSASDADSWIYEVRPNIAEFNDEARTVPTADNQISFTIALKPETSKVSKTLEV
ncbi:hypothetical protein [Rhodohalobacter sp. SW132]|uniref:hypothetical protein n=1 Tax=Rhodohalobacter sp. SW132 TaxID=2293433 RepID=UPI001314256E|nr:hypothetical protein [Rhodohalobacter sp. SW132]